MLLQWPTLWSLARAGHRQDSTTHVFTV
uniref:Uncharacterized protein n=1 Tax=Zea mays TaxID=4577 RepID=C4J837_MAIZE|nr:unknown [Zea mays]ACR37504.1 unknown [Zea mays]